MRPHSPNPCLLPGQLALAPPSLADLAHPTLPYAFLAVFAAK
jgi:hypothetical protein